MTPNDPFKIKTEMQPRLQQKLKLSIQQIQNLDILQLPALELTDRIYKELEENPTLEIIGETQTEASKQSQSAEEQKTTSLNLDDSGEGNVSGNVLEVLDYERDIPSRKRIESMREYTERKAEAMQNTPAKPETLQDYVFFQFEMMDVPDTMKAIGKEIIYNISDDGYLRVSLEDIALRTNASVEDVQEVLRHIHKLDPPGIAARNLPECLLLQLSDNDPNLKIKKVLISQYLEQLQPHKIAGLAKLIKKSPDKIQKVVDEIKTLNPHPASDFSSEDVDYVTPDIIISKIDLPAEASEQTGLPDAQPGGTYEIIIRNEYLPGLTISDYYQQLIKSKKGDKDAKRYIRQKIMSAKGLMQAIQLRKVTLRQLAEQILLKQRDFFDGGIKSLRPLKMKDVAENLKVHLSTISRVVSNKYIQTPHGLFPVKFFFLNTTETAEGNSYSQPKIHAALKEIIERENKQKPLRDDQIAAALAEKQIIMSRRTVSKYRQFLNIPNHTYRKAIETQHQNGTRN